MKRSEVNVENLLDQLSEEKINRVVDSNVVRAGWSSKSEKSCHSGNSNSSSEAAAQGNGGVSGGISVGVGVTGSGGIGLGI